MDPYAKINEATRKDWELGHDLQDKSLKEVRKFKRRNKIQKKEDTKAALLAKLQRYVNSMGISQGDRVHVVAECRRLERKLDIRVIQPREYVFLAKMREAIINGMKPDLKTMAIQSGYSIREATEPEVTILRDIPQPLLSEMIGFSQSDIETELVKIMKQDDDLSAKIRAIEVASKILGVLKDDKAVKIQINSGIKLGD